MKKYSGLLTYLAALLVGVILLIFCKEAQLLQIIIIAIGVIIAIPSILTLVKSLIPTKNPDGTKSPDPWYSILAGLAGIVLAIWMIVNPSFFINIIVYTLGAILIFAGVMGWIDIMQTIKPSGSNLGWYITPSILIIGGILFCIIGNSMLGFAANITAGVLLVIYAVNGFASLGRKG